MNYNRRLVRYEYLSCCEVVSPHWEIVRMETALLLEIMNSQREFFETANKILTQRNGNTEFQFDYTRSKSKTAGFHALWRSLNLKKSRTPLRKDCTSGLRESTKDFKTADWLQK